MRYRLRGPGDVALSAMDFSGAARMRTRGGIDGVYALSVNRYQGLESLDLHLRAIM